MSYCSQCGQQADEEARFCSLCGSALQVQPQAAVWAGKTHAFWLGVLSLALGVGFFVLSAWLTFTTADRSFLTLGLTSFALFAVVALFSFVFGSRKILILPSQVLRDANKRPHEGGEAHS